MSNYQMTGAVGGAGAGLVEVGTDGGKVVLKPWKGDIVLDGAKQEEFAQLLVEACAQAKVNAARVTVPDAADMRAIPGWPGD